MDVILNKPIKYLIGLILILTPLSIGLYIYNALKGDTDPGSNSLLRVVEERASTERLKSQAEVFIVGIYAYDEEVQDVAVYSLIQSGANIPIPRGPYYTNQYPGYLKTRYVANAKGECADLKFDVLRISFSHSCPIYKGDILIGFSEYIWVNNNDADYILDKEELNKRSQAFNKDVSDLLYKYALQNECLLGESYLVNCKI